MSNSLWPHGLQHARLPCLSVSVRVCSISSPLSQRCYLNVSSSVTPFSSCPNLSQNHDLSQWVSSSHQVAKILELQHQSFQWLFRVTSFRIDWFDFLAVQGTLKTSPTPPFESINSSVLSLLYSPTLSSVHDYWKNHSFDYTDLCQQVMFLLFNMLPRVVIAFLPRSKHLLILWCSYFLSWFGSQHSRNEDHASSPITSWQIDGEKVETVEF